MLPALDQGEVQPGAARGVGPHQLQRREQVLAAGGVRDGVEGPYLVCHSIAHRCHGCHCCRRCHGRAPGAVAGLVPRHGVPHAEPALEVIGRRGRGGGGQGHVGAYGVSEAFGDVLHQRRVRARPAPEPAADRLLHQVCGVVGRDAPAAEEPAQNLMAVPVPAAAAARAVGDVQDQGAGGPVPQDPLVVDAGEIQRVRPEPGGKPFQPLPPLPPFPQRRGHPVEGFVRGGDRVQWGEPTADRPSTEVPFVVCPPPADDPTAVMLGQGPGHRVGPGPGLLPAPVVQRLVARGNVRTSGHPPGRSERPDHACGSLAVERMTGGGDLRPGQIAG